MSQKYQKYVFSDSERNALKMARESAPPDFDEPTSHGNWVAFYTKLSEILGAHIDAGTVTGPDLQDFKSVKLWTDVAISANGGAGLHSTFIRAFTDYQGYLRLGRHFSAEEMQKASNGVALNLYLSLSGLRSVEGYDPWTVPKIAQLAQYDASAIGVNLYAGHLSESDDAVVFNTGWSGTLGFNLLGGEESFESWRLLAEPARDGLEAASRPENQRLDSFDDFKNILFATAAYEAAWKASSFEAGAVAAYELARFIAFVQTRRLLPSNDAYLRSIAAQIEINLANDNWLGLVKDVAAFSPAISPAVNLMADVGPANFLDMMRSAYEGQALLWQTKHAQFQDAAYAFFSPMSAQQREGIGARMLPMEQEQLVRMARSDVDVRNALQALSALSVDTAAVGLDTSHLQIYDAQSGTGRLTERWLQDRAAFLIAQTQELQQGNGSVLRDPQRLRYYDMSSEQEVLQGFGSHRRQIVFGAAGGSNLQGQGFDDRLYGGDEADRLEGKGGSDYLEGGQGHDTYVLSSQDSGVDTIVDVDGDGHLEVDGGAISGVYKRHHSQSTSYYSADGRTRIDVLPSGVHTQSQGPEGQAGAAGQHTLGVYRLDGTQWRQLAHVLDWKDQGLGLQLSDELGEPERHVVTQGGDRYYDTFEAADRPVQISTGDKRDYVNGSAFSDHISLGESHDIALAGLGNDFIDGGAGGDFILAGPDVREPGSSANDHDVLVGGAGRDKLKGGAGDDVLYAMAMEDDIDSEGTATGDWLLGGSGDDMLHGSRAGDVLNGGAGNDRIRGGHGGDVILGDGGLESQNKYVTLDIGQSGYWDIDPITGQPIYVPPQTPGREYQWDAARAQYRARQVQSVVILNGPSLRWTMDTSSASNYTVSPLMGWYGGQEVRLEDGGGNDWIEAGAGDDWMAGQAGDDVLHGGDDNDVLYGDDAVAMPEGSEGNDKLFAGEGRDKLFGGAGSDLLDASEHDGDLDVLRGGGGRDELIGGTGGDELYGEDGEDTLHAGVGGGRMEGGQDGDHYHSSAGDDLMFDVHGNDTYHLSQGQDQITDLGGHDIYELSFGHLALGGRTLVQDLDGEGSIRYHSRTLKSEDWRATQAGQWQSRDGQLLLQRSGDDLQLRSATPGAQEGVVVFASFFSQQQFLGLQLPEYVPPSTEEPPIDPPQEPQPGSPIVGSEADDTLTGTAARDEIYGLQGNDQIYGLEGDDFLAGYEGNDFLAGGDGRDQLHGDDGDDQLHGGWGEDRIAGGQGQDFIAGGPGDDQLFGDDGEDQLYGDQGSDSLYGGPGHDQLFGNEGDDYLEGGQGEDRLDGGAGRDVLHGGQGSDSLYGGSDGDFYILQAGDGQDRLIEVLDDSAAHDIIELRGLASSDNWQLRRVGQDLHLHYGQGGQDLLIVQDQFAAGAMAIEEIRFSDGVSLSAEQIAQQAIDSAAPDSGSAQGADTGSGTGSKHGSADQGLTAQPGAAARADIAALLAAAQALPKPASAANADNLPWALGENLQPQAWQPQHGLAQTPWHAQTWEEADSAPGSTPSSALDSALSSAAQAQQLIAAMAAMAPADALASASFMTAAGYQPGSYQDLTKPLLAAAA